MAYQRKKYPRSRSVRLARPPPMRTYCREAINSTTSILPMTPTTHENLCGPPMTTPPATLPAAIGAGHSRSSRFVPWLMTTTCTHTPASCSMSVGPPAATKRRGPVGSSIPPVPLLPTPSQIHEIGATGTPRANRVPPDMVSATKHQGCMSPRTSWRNSCIKLDPTAFDSPTIVPEMTRETYSPSHSVHSAELHFRHTATLALLLASDAPPINPNNIHYRTLRSSIYYPGRSAQPTNDKGH